MLGLGDNFTNGGKWDYRTLPNKLYELVKNLGDMKQAGTGYYTDTESEMLTVLAYLKKLPIAVAPMSVEDIFDGEVIEPAGIIEDGNFTFPVDFIHYYEKYNIGIPEAYEDYIKSKL